MAYLNSCINCTTLIPKLSDFPQCGCGSGWGGVGWEVRLASISHIALLPLALVRLGLLLDIHKVLSWTAKTGSQFILLMSLWLFTAPCWMVTIFPTWRLAYTYKLTLMCHNILIRTLMFTFRIDP
jgi:hypothetical protein